MSEHDLEKLLGGFAADTLMPEERIRLYTAAMQDQQLFNALADEQALKELLADPLVRGRLLRALRKPGTSEAGGTLSWWAWLRRPAGLAFAGGLAAAIFAAAFGTKIYLESLDQGAQPVVTEDATPSTPPTPAPQPSKPAQSSDAEPQLKAKESVDSMSKPAKKDALADKSAERKRMAAPPASQEPRAEQDEARKQVGESPAPAVASTPKALQAPSHPPATGTVLPPVSARALFYGSEPGRPDRQGLTAETEQGLNSLSKSAPQANRPEGKAERFAAAGKATGAAVQPKPLGLRYSFVMKGSEGQDREVDAATAAKSPGLVRISVEASQDAYLQILQTLGTAGTRLWWPQQETGKISLKVLAGKRNEIPLPPPAESGLLSLIIRLSPKPFGPLTVQEVGMLDRFSANLLIESVSPGNSTGLQEQATYVVSRESSPTTQIAVEIPISR
ncbi:MAG: hypothetical protein HY348_05340 [Nitrospira defluvii]|nr:hypothetical protein [Nitrospira defluvii]